MKNNLAETSGFSDVGSRNFPNWLLLLPRSFLDYMNIWQEWEKH